MIGMGERTTPMGVEMLAREAASSAGIAHRVLAVELPKARSAMHLDTAAHHGRRRHLRGLPVLRPDCGALWLLTPGDGGTGGRRSSAAPG